MKLYQRMLDPFVRPVVKRQARLPADVPANERGREYAFVFEHIARLGLRNLLDVGTGESALPSLLHTAQLKVDAIDYVQGYWRQGLFNWHYPVRFANVCTLTPASNYDGVLCISTLEHIPDHLAAVKGMASQLKSGGYLIVTCPYTESRYYPNVYELAESTAKDLNFITQSFSRQELDQWLAETGLEIREQEYWRYFDGDAWTVGNRIFPGEASTAETQHQLTCLLLQKR